jgi:hypothetical protein
VAYAGVLAASKERLRTRRRIGRTSGAIGAGIFGR